MTLHSMTAFAREATQAPVAISIELRSVNHRYLDCHFKLPDSLRALEPKFRDGLASALRRGKIDCQIKVALNQAGTSLDIDGDRLRALARALDTVLEAIPEAEEPDTLALLQFPGVCVGDASDESTLQATAMELFATALQSLQANRAREGAQLAEFLCQRLSGITAEVLALRKGMPALRERQEERLRRRLDELEQPVDENRLEQELVLLLQKSDVDEELDRLEAHVEEVRRVLRKGGPCGRRLDFLMQELNREANTLSSKATVASTTQSAVELKVLIEQMREQVQNIE
jgi:uncharacterized protein (TIGR00255 family)